NRRLGEVPVFTEDDRFPTAVVRQAEQKLATRFQDPGQLGRDDTWFVEMLDHVPGTDGVERVRREHSRLQHAAADIQSPLAGPLGGRGGRLDADSLPAAGLELQQVVTVAAAQLEHPWGLVNPL